MTSASAPLWISAIWLSLTLLAALAADVSSIRGWMLVTTLGIVPGFVLLKLWGDGRPRTMAEVLRATEAGR